MSAIPHTIRGSRFGRLLVAALLVGVATLIVIFGSALLQLGLALVLIGAALAQYLREKSKARETVLVVSMTLIYLAGTLIDLTRSGPVPSDGPLNLALDGLALVALVIGVYALYRYWQLRG